MNVRKGIVVMLLGCAVPAAASDPPAFCVVADATDISHPDRTNASVDYYVREPFPAPKTLAFILTCLAARGWAPLDGPGISKDPSSSPSAGWQELLHEEGSFGMRLWSARWRDPKGNEVVYTLSYGSSLVQQGLQPTHVEVGAWYYSKKEALRERARIERRAEALRRSTRLPQPSPTPYP